MHIGRVPFRLPSRWPEARTSTLHTMLWVLFPDDRICVPLPVPIAHLSSPSRHLYSGLANWPITLFSMPVPDKPNQMSMPSGVKTGLGSSDEKVYSASKEVTVEGNIETNAPYPPEGGLRAWLTVAGAYVEIWIIHTWSWILRQFLHDVPHLWNDIQFWGFPRLLHGQHVPNVRVAFPDNKRIF